MRATISTLVAITTLLPACGDIAPPPAIQECHPLDPDSPAKEANPSAPIMPSQDPGFESQFCQKSTCGNITWQGNFKLPMPAATSGWIVQEISFELNVTGGEHRQGHYWEGFFVKQGGTRAIYEPGPDDTYQTTGETTHPANSKGLSTFIGKAKFYEGTLPADFICPNEATRAAGALRATPTQPPFWDGTGTAHNLTVTWDCTGGNDINTVLAEPDPDGFCPKN